MIAGAPRRTTPMRVSSDPADVESVTIRYLMYVLLPAWFVPGIADYWMHRRTGIERTSGVRESAIHALMMTEISVPMLLTLLCEVNPLLLGSARLRPGCTRRRPSGTSGPPSMAAVGCVPPNSTSTASWKSLPFMAMSALLCLHWDQVAGLWQGGAGAGAWRLRLRQRRLPSGYLAGVLGAVGALIAAPYAEELWRCAKTGKN